MPSSSPPSRSSVVLLVNIYCLQLVACGRLLKGWLEVIARWKGPAPSPSHQLIGLFAVWEGQRLYYREYTSHCKNNCIFTYWPVWNVAGMHDAGQLIAKVFSVLSETTSTRLLPPLETIYQVGAFETKSLLQQCLPSAEVFAKSAFLNSFSNGSRQSYAWAIGFAGEGAVIIRFSTAP